MPKARRSSCTRPLTSRLAPDTICPAASSTVAMVSAAPGRNVTNGGMRMRTGLSICDVLQRGEHDDRDDERDDDREHELERRQSRQLRQPDQQAEDEGGADRADGRLQEEGEADRHHGMAERPDRPAERRRHAVDRVQPVERLVG